MTKFNHNKANLWKLKSEDDEAKITENEFLEANFFIRLVPNTSKENFIPAMSHLNKIL